MHVSTELFPNAEVTAAVTEYAIANSTGLGEVINQHRNDTLEFTQREAQDPAMMINTLQAQFMVFIAKMHRVKKVLEIGCFTGYSALAWASAVSDYPDGEVVTLDLDYVATTFAESTFAKQDTNKVIKLIKGPASETITTLAGRQFDLIFIDANKEGYIEYLQKVLSLKLLAPNGVIFADNTLYRGLVANTENNPAAKNQAQVGRSKHIDAFNKFVAAHQELENVLVPAFDGINMIRYKNGGS